MSFITTNDGTEIYYKDWGSGAPIVFSHGWPLSADDWDIRRTASLRVCILTVARQRAGVVLGSVNLVRMENMLCRNKASLTQSRLTLATQTRADMKRSLFIAAAASTGAVSISRPLLAKAEGLTKCVGVETNVKAPGRCNPTWYCGSAVVWLDIPSGTYYHKGDRRYGRTERGAYTCEKEAIGAGHRAGRDGR